MVHACDSSDDEFAFLSQLLSVQNVQVGEYRDKRRTEHLAVKNVVIREWKLDGMLTYAHMPHVYGLGNSVARAGLSGLLILEGGDISTDSNVYIYSGNLIKQIAKVELLLLITLALSFYAKVIRLSWRSNSRSAHTYCFHHSMANDFY